MTGARRDPDSPVRSDEDLTGALEFVRGTSFERCRFAACALQEADLTDCRFIECRFEGSNLSAARIPGSVWRDVAFAGCKLSGIDWSAAARFGDVAFDACVLDDSAFLGMKLRRAVLRDCRLRNVSFAEADLTEADLARSDLQGAQFARTKLARADLRGATGYTIHPGENDVRGLRVSMPDALSLLLSLGVVVEA